MVGDNVSKQLSDFIVANFLLGDTGMPLDPNDSFMNSGILDSTGVLELVSFVEETFNIKIQDNELLPENLDSLNRLTAFISHKASN